MSSSPVLEAAAFVPHLLTAGLRLWWARSAVHFPHLLFALSSASAPLLHLTPFVNGSTCQIRLRRKTLSVFTASPEVPPITAVLRNCALSNQAPPQRSKEALTQHIKTPNAASSTFQNPHFFCDLWCSPPGCYCLLCSSSCELQRAVRLPFRSVPISWSSSLQAAFKSSRVQPAPLLPAANHRVILSSMLVDVGYHFTPSILKLQTALFWSNTMLLSVRCCLELITVPPLLPTLLCIRFDCRPIASSPYAPPLYCHFQMTTYSRSRVLKAAGL